MKTEMDQRFPQKFWDWYAEGKARPCPVHGHGILSNHSIRQLAECAVKKGVIDWADVPEDFERKGFADFLRLVGNENVVAVSTFDPGPALFLSISSILDKYCDILTYIAYYFKPPTPTGPRNCYSELLIFVDSVV